MTTDNASTKVVTGKVRLSYCNVFEARSVDSGDEKFSTSLLIPKTDKVTLGKIKTVVELLKKQAMDKNNGKLPAKFHTPLRDGDEEADEKGEDYRGHFFMNASSKNQPGIAKPVGKNADGTTKFQTITDTTEVYSGCYAKLSINFYLFDQKGNKGIAAGLNNVVKVQDGESLSLAGRASVDADFANEDFDTEGDDDDFMN